MKAFLPMDASEMEKRIGIFFNNEDILAINVEEYLKDVYKA
jgi:hypothetical protein